MSLGTTIRNLDWVLTLRLAAIRVVAGSLVLYVGQMWSSNAIYNPIIIVVFFTFGFLILAPAALVSGAIGRAGVPFIGLIGLPFMLFTIVGDPLVWILHQVRADWVGVDRFGFFNPAFVFILKDQLGSELA